MVRYIEMNILENRQMNLIQHRQTKLESQKKIHPTIKDKNNIDLTEGDKILFFPHYSGYDNVPGKISEISILTKETKPAEFNLIIESDKPLCGFRKKHTYRVKSPVQWITYDEKQRVRSKTPPIQIPSNNIAKENYKNSYSSDEIDDDFENWKATELFKIDSSCDDEKLQDFDKDPVYDQNDLNFQDGNPLVLKEIDIFEVKKQ